MSDDVDVIVLCVSTASTPEKPMPDATRQEGACGHEVWAGPATLALEADPRYDTVELLCTACGVIRAQLEKVEGVGLTPEMEEEIITSGLVSRTELEDSKKRLGLTSLEE